MTQVDAAALMKIRSLELRARAVVEGAMRGLHRSPFHGFSVEFSEYRPYVAGDDVRFIDWRLYARTDRDYVKRFEDETNLRCTLLVDRSRSMSYGTLGWTKADYGATLAATLAHFLAGQGDAVGLVTFSDGAEELLPPRSRPGQLRRLMLALERPVTGRATDLPRTLARIAELLARRGMVVLVSDLLAPPEALDEALGGLCARGQEVAVFHLMDPAERTFPFEGSAHFCDMESDRRMLLDASSARGAYLRRLDTHLAAVRAACARRGVSHHLVSTDQPLDGPLVQFLAGRPRRRR